MQIRKEELNFFLCKRLDLICRKAKESMCKKLLRLIKYISKVAGFKINIQNFIVFLYNDLSEKNNLIYYSIMKKKKKNFEIKLIKEMKYL